MSRTRLLDEEVGRAMSALSATAKKGLGDPVLAELVMIRASQLNHCAFCLDMHLTAARRNGESEERIQLLNAWEETEDLYTEQERAALALTEAVTVLTGGTSRTKSGGGFVPDEVYDRAAKHFDEARLAHLIALISVINSWNRLMVSRRIPPGGYRP
ncbi:carboxymuconolactone decarboxylase family protein [Streptomyces mexicanus]|jgi:AhpD family alkylhydroperoxidase|uniref:carboxymuconolactone decarboxylase family protein n=1 Tax=Streptomyces mexicanus TaxID=178566 RepID=UPI0031EB7C53